MIHAHHHKHKRKRFHLNLEPFPHPIRWKRNLDRMITVLGLGNLVATVPQITQIYVYQDASGVSPFSWGYYTVFAFVFAFYGMAHNEKPIIITYSASFLMYLTVTVGSIIY